MVRTRHIIRFLTAFLLLAGLVGNTLIYFEDPPLPPSKGELFLLEMNCAHNSHCENVPPCSLSSVNNLSLGSGDTGKTPSKEVAKAMAVVPLKGPINALMVDAVVNDQVLGTFILDTGATYTSISREMAESLGVDLTHCERVTITTANGRISVPKIKISRISINGLEATNIETTVIDIRKGATFSGLLGLSFIKQFKLTIDPQAGQLVLQGQ